jgi:hypothetical protein
VTKWINLVGGAVVFCVGASHAAVLEQQVTFTINGTPRYGGDLRVDLNVIQNGGLFEHKARFSFNPELGVDVPGPLDNHCQFRWIQIITQDPAAPPFNGGTVPNVPFMDPPRGGYDYQAGNGGADNDPFYENTGPGNFAYPNYAQRRTPGVDVFTDDYPGLSPSETVSFETFLCVWDPTGMCGPVSMIKVLTGYSWSVSRNAAGTRSTGGPTLLADLNAGVGRINTAITNSGWAAGAFTAVNDNDLTCCVPVPGSLSMLAIGGMLAVRRRRAA